MCVWNDFREENSNCKQKDVDGMNTADFLKYNSSHKPEYLFAVAVEGAEAANFLQSQATDTLDMIIRSKNLKGKPSGGGKK